MTLIPTQVTFHGIAHSPALEADIREHVTWLEQFYSGLVGCRVRVEIPHRHRQTGRHLEVHIELTVPGNPPIVVSHAPTLHAGLKSAEKDAHRKEADIDGVHRHAHVAVREAFDIARRRLQDAARETRGAVKTHVAP